MSDFDISKIKLIVGLGNVGAEYKRTRHNAGFLFVDTLASSEFKAESKFRGSTSLMTNDNRNKIALLKPSTMMNLSGHSVSDYIKYFDIDTKEVLVVYDDLDIELGSFKIQYKRHPRVHNGVNNIIDILGNDSFWNLRIGVENRNKDQMEHMDGKDYLLSKFSSEEIEILNKTFDTINYRIVEAFTEKRSTDIILDE